VASSSATGEHPVLIASAVTVRYPRGMDREPPPALDSVDLELVPGDRVAVVGPNGAGKSSLLFVLAGLRRPDRGTVRVGDGSRPPDEDPARLPSAALARRLGLVFQNPELGFLGRTVAEEVAASLPATGRAADPADQSVTDSLSAFGLDLLAKVDPYHLSEGEQRRLSIAAASLSGSRILLLDEPTFGLDRRGAAAVLAVLERLQTDGQAQLVATHDPRLIGSCRRVVALDGGRVVFDGSSAAFLAAPPYAPPEPWMRAVQP
jgi:energy-coupling factor transporter ATP-binding protein EcfA2